jgi:hypothetical protein
MKTGETKTGELKRPRNYSLEHQRRKEKKTRLLVDIDKNKAEAFTGLLNKQGVTFSQWIKDHINNELKDQK